MTLSIIRDAWEIDATEEAVGVGYDGMRLQTAKYGTDEPPFDPCQVPGCAEPLEYGHASFPTARCSQGHIWKEIDGVWEVINLWRM